VASIGYCSLQDIAERASGLASLVAVPAAGHYLPLLGRSGAISELCTSLSRVSTKIFEGGSGVSLSELYKV
jgi:hypothetical protein